MLLLQRAWRWQAMAGNTLETLPTDVEARPTPC